MTEITDSFWLDSPEILYRTDRLTEFFVSCDMNNTEKMNALMRFGIYISIILVLYYSEPKYLLLIILVAFITIFVNMNSSSENYTIFTPSSNVPIIGNKRTKPTLNNPFMNSSSIDFFDNPDKPIAEDYSTVTQESLKVKKDIKDAFDYNLYQDIGDLYSTSNSFRQFYTVNNGDYIPDRNGDYKNFLFGGMTSGKQNTYEDFKNLSDPLQNRPNIN
jgi:hypothetical protein